MRACRVVDDRPLLVRAARDPVRLVHDRQVERRHRVPRLLGLFDLVQGVVGADHRQRPDVVFPLPHDRHQLAQRVRVGGRQDTGRHQIGPAFGVHRGHDHNPLAQAVADGLAL